MAKANKDPNLMQRIPCIFIVIVSEGKARIRLQSLTSDVLSLKDFELQCCEGTSLATAGYIAEILNKHVDTLHYAA